MNADLRRHLGDPGQLLQTRRFRLDSGDGAGMPCVDVQNSAGLAFTLAADRCLDILQARYRGVNLSYISRGGPIALSRRRGVFDADCHYGMLFTCGLENTGPACESRGIVYPQHGTIGLTPADNVVVEETEEDGVPAVAVAGVMEQRRCGDEYLRLERRVACRDDRPVIRLRDRVINTGAVSAALVIMYHFNLGYPLLSEEARLEIPSSSIVPKNERSAAAVGRHLEVPPPSAGFEPQALRHTLLPGADGVAACTLRNPSLGIALILRVNCRQLPVLNHWRMFRDCRYVMGLEPCNQLPLGRKELEAKGMLPMLEPGEERVFEVELGLEQI